MIKKEVFNKFIKLLSAGIIPTSAKDIQGLKLGDLTNLPIKGTEVIDITDGIASRISFNELDISEQIGNSASLLESLKEYNYITEKIKAQTNIQIDKRPDTYSYCLSLRGCYLIRDGIIIDRNINEYTYKIDISEFDLTKDNEFTALNDSIYYTLIFNNYLKDILDGTFNDYEVVRLLNNSITNFNMPLNIINEGFTQEDEDLWVNNLSQNIKVYIDFELNIFDTNLEMEDIKLSHVIYAIDENVV